MKLYVVKCTYIQTERWLQVTYRVALLIKNLKLNELNDIFNMLSKDFPRLVFKHFAE